MARYKYEIITQSVGDTTVSHQGEFESDCTIAAGMDLTSNDISGDLFDDPEKILKVSLTKLGVLNE